jgi:hypothetical protein
MAPEDLEKSLDVLHQSGWQLPPLAMQPDDEGLTLVACWLKTSLSRLRSNRLADVEAPMTGSIAGVPLPPFLLDHRDRYSVFTAFTHN